METKPKRKQREPVGSMKTWVICSDYTMPDGRVVNVHHTEKLADKLVQAGYAPNARPTSRRNTWGPE